MSTVWVETGCGVASKSELLIVCVILLLPSICLLLWENPTKVHVMLRVWVLKLLEKLMIIFPLNTFPFGSGDQEKMQKVLRALSSSSCPEIKEDVLHWAQDVNEVIEATTKNFFKIFNLVWVI